MDDEHIGRHFSKQNISSFYLHVFVVCHASFPHFDAKIVLTNCLVIFVAAFLLMFGWAAVQETN